MNVLRSALLSASDSPWIRRKATESRVVRKAVSRFMPGETLDEALAAASTLGQQGLGTILTRLGENVGDRAEVEEVERHYFEVIDRVRAAGLDAEVSVKLTQLGLDLSSEMASTGLSAIAARAAEVGNRVWVDMEDSRTTERTLDIFRSVRRAHANVGIAIQTYLYRSAADLESLIPLGARVRLVKGAYREPASIAFPRKRDVDESFFKLATRLLDPDARAQGARLTAGTHDLRLIDRIRQHAATVGVPAGGFEIAMLYGIQREAQLRLAREGVPTRALISYGSSWFPWYMRRLAERPANLLFVLRNAVGG